MVKSLFNTPPILGKLFVSWNSLLSIAKISLYLFHGKRSGTRYSYIQRYRIIDGMNQVIRKLKFEADVALI